MNPKKFFLLLKNAALAWSDDNASSYGAALAFYTAFSLAPLLLIAISLASIFVSEDSARQGVDAQVRQTLGTQTADVVSSTLKNAYDTGGNSGVTIAGLITLLVRASGVFVQLQDALNVIWKTASQPRKGNAFVHFLKNRLLSFAAVVGTGFLLLVSLIASAILAALSDWLTSFPGSTLLWQGVAALVSFCFIAVMFALIFKMLPDCQVAWRDVWIGAIFLTALLFTVGQQLIGIYLGQAGTGSAHGAAGSLVILLLWVYYSAQIVLYGAEFTHAYAVLCGSKSESADSPNRPNRKDLYPADQANVCATV